MTVLAYLGILIVIPFLMTKDNQFVKFHIKQGLVLIIFAISLSILSSVLSMFVTATRVPFFGILFLIFPLLWLFVVILTIIGIVNASQGRTKELPVIGGFGGKFNF